MNEEIMRKIIYAIGIINCLIAIENIMINDYMMAIINLFLAIYSYNRLYGRDLL